MTFDPDYICGNTVYLGTETIFGLDVQEGQIDLYYFYIDEQEEFYSIKTAEATLSNQSWEYVFEDSYQYGRTEYPYSVTGTFSLIP